MRKGGGRRKRGRMKMKEVMKGGKGWEGARRVEPRQVNPKEGFRGDLKILRSTHSFLIQKQPLIFRQQDFTPPKFSFVLRKAKSSR
jgi:hypothetical protein